MRGKRKEENNRGVTAGDDDIYELRLRNDRDGFDLMSDSFRCGAIWYSGPDAVRHGVAFARYRSHRLARYATVRVLDASGAVIQMYESSDSFRQQKALDEFNKRGELFIGTHYETLPVVPIVRQNVVSPRPHSLF